MKRQVIVTGAGGLIGHAARLRLECAGIATLGLDLVSGTIEGLPVLGCDLCDPEALRAVVAGRTFDGILHCGAMSGPTVGRENPRQLVAVNVMGTANMLDLARERGIPRFVYASSVSAYGDCRGQDLDESTPLKPTVVYGATKAASEMLVAAYGLEHGLSAVSLRISMVYGPRRQTACSLRDMLVSALSGTPLRQDWGQDLLRHPVHVDDVAAAAVAALQVADFAQAAYNITGGPAVTLGQVADIVRDIVPGADIVLGTTPLGGDNVQGSHSIAAAQRDLGYRPAVVLREGLAHYADWLRGELGDCAAQTGARAP